MFLIDQKDGKWARIAECDEVDAAKMIEDWKSRFTDLKPTQYGFTITREYLLNMTEGEIALFEETKQAMRVTRV